LKDNTGVTWLVSQNQKVSELLAGNPVYCLYNTYKRTGAGRRAGDGALMSYGVDVSYLCRVLDVVMVPNEDQFFTQFKLKRLEAEFENDTEFNVMLDSCSNLHSDILGLLHVLVAYTEANAKYAEYDVLKKIIATNEPYAPFIDVVLTLDEFHLIRPFMYNEVKITQRGFGHTPKYQKFTFSLKSEHKDIENGNQT
jgi:hypothetical protein